MVGMVENNLIAKASENGVELPLMLEERLQVLCKRGWEALYSQPFGEGILERKEVSGFAGVKGTVHIGCQENAEMWW